MPLGKNFNPKIKPKIKSNGEVVDYNGSESDLTLDYLMGKPRGFLKEYWPVVNQTKRWIFAELPNRNGLSSDFSKARKNGKGSNEYNNAASNIRSLAIEFLNQKSQSGLGLDLDRRVVMQLISNEVLGMSILEPIWNDPRVHEVYVNGPFDIQVEMDDGLHRVDGASFENQEHALEFCSKLLGDYNKTLDSSNCVAESRLADGSRFEATHPAICPEGPNIDIRRHDTKYWTISDLVHTGMTNKEMLIDIERYIRLGLSFLVIGGTSTGKTTVLNALSGLFPNGQRIITIEDTLELHINPNKYVAAPMEARPAGLNGTGEISLRKLVKTSLRLSPKIMVIGETRGAEAYDLVEGANTGHQVFSTLHANNANHAISRVEMAISQGGELVGTETLGAIQSAFAIIIEISKFMKLGGRTRRIITGIHEVDTHLSKNAAGEPVLGTRPLWRFEITGVGKDNTVIGDWKRVSDISIERQQMMSNFNFTHPLTWNGMLALENVSRKKRMFQDDTPMFLTASEYEDRSRKVSARKTGGAPAPIPVPIPQNISEPRRDNHDISRQQQK